MGIVVGGAMKRDWRIRRELLAIPEGQRRWDRAYQALLTWPCPDGAAPLSNRVPCQAGRDSSDLG
jgi:uncharacterized protein (UPF0548 family)